MRYSLQVRCPRAPARVAYPVALCILSAGWDTRFKCVAPLWPRVSHQLWPRGSYQLDEILAPSSLPCGPVYPVAPWSQLWPRVSYQLWPRVSYQLDGILAPSSLPRGPLYPVAPCIPSAVAPYILSAAWDTHSKLVAPWPRASCGPMAPAACVVYPSSWMGYSLQVRCPVAPCIL